MSSIKLQSCDGEEFTVPISVAQCSGTIKTMLEDLGLEDGDDETVPLPNVEGKTLKRVVEWATHHKNDSKTSDEGTNDNDGEITGWDAKFIEMDKEDLFSLTRAANYLDVKGLLDLTCQAVANMIKGKQPKEIRELFGLS